MMSQSRFDLIVCVVGVLAVLSCATPSAKPSEASPVASAPIAAPVVDAPPPRSLASLLGTLDPQCSDTCCLPSWFTRGHLSPGADDITAATAVIEDPGAQPRDLALALRLAGSSVMMDAAKLTRFVDDVRDAGTLPQAQFGQAMQRCYSVVWERTSPSREALDMLGGRYRQRFGSASEYHVWAAAHPDPEGSLDVWVGRLSSTRPPPEALVTQLRARGPDLFRETMLVACANGDCGLRDEEMARSIVQWDRAKALDWLTLRDKPGWSPEQFGSARSTIMKLCDRVFDARDVPRLEAFWKDGDPQHPFDRAPLAVCLSRLRPQNATRYWTDTLPDMNAYSAATILREAAKRAPAEMEPVLTKYFFVDPGSDPHAAFVDGPVGAAATLRGLSEGSDARGAKVFARLVRRPWKSTDRTAMESLAQAATHLGCTGIPDPATLLPRAGKWGTKEEWEAETRRADGVAAVIASAARSCASKLLAIPQGAQTQ